MATYIQGVTDYIPQIQPFQPDYNFLGNVLQTKQTRYDSAHKQLNQMYGTLLYSPMLRDDNTQQRDQFFQAIDQDIKKMSGLDLSLQDNVDAADNVFKSMYDNKGIIKDMTFTKQYQNELARAENFKTCLDQDKCGGGYWDVGVNALQFKADEFKNASAEDAMNMSAPSYNPYINITEKAVKYAKDLMGAGFSVSKVDKSEDGRYLITSKDGQNLTVPLYQLLQNQYGNDSKIQNMYFDMAYVQRKNYVKTNAERFGGDENAAEEDYMNTIQQKVDQIKVDAVKAQQDALTAQSTKLALAEKIKKDGTTGDDSLSQAYQLASFDSDQHDQNATYTDQSAKTAAAVANSGDNKKMKLSNIDAVVARSLMNGDFQEAAINVSNLTGSQKVEADPYEKSYFEHSLKMEEIKYTSDLKTKKEKESSEIAARGSATSGLNTPTYIEGLPGTSTSTEAVDEAKEMADYKQQQSNSTLTYANNYVDQYTNHLLNIVNDNRFSQAEKTVAKGELKKIFPEYDVNANVFKNEKGDNVDYNTLFNREPLNRYNRAYSSRKTGSNEALYGDFFKETLDPIAENYSTSRDLLDASSQVYRENNKNVMQFAITSDQYVKEDKRAEFKALFKANGDLRNLEEYQKEATAGTGLSYDDAATSYEKMMKIYNTVYNSGSSVGGKPIVKAFVDGNIALGLYAEGKSAGGGIQYDFDATTPAAIGTSGLLTFGANAQKSINTLYSGGIVGDVDDAGDASANAGYYKQALDTVMNDIKTGSFDTKDGTRPFGQVTYLDTALSDPNYKAIHIKFNQAYLDKYKGSDKNKGWGQDPTITKDGITIYIPKAESDNSFTKSVEAKPYDLILNVKPLTISTTNGGSVTITKDKSTGGFNVTGALTNYTGNFINGKAEQAPAINPTKKYSPNVGGDHLYQSLRMWLAQLDAANTAILNHQTVQKTHDVYDLPNLGSALSAQQGITQ